MNTKISLLIAASLAASVVAGFAQETEPAPVLPDAPETAEPAETQPAPEEEAFPAPEAEPIFRAGEQSDFPGLGEGDEVAALISFEEQPLPKVIGILARQAGINYQFDPRLAPGAIGPDGKPIEPPVVSVRWENVTASQALIALLENHSMRIVHDPRTGIARITIKDPAAPEPLVSQVLQLRNTTPTTNLVAVLKATLSTRSQIHIDTRTRQLLVLTTEREMPALEELVTQLDTPSKQILIEANIIQTRKNPLTVRGIDWTGTLERQGFEFGNGLVIPDPTSTVGTTGFRRNVGGIAPGTVSSTYATAGGGISEISVNTRDGFFPNTAFLTADGVRAALSFLNTEEDTESLATPRTIAMEGYQAELSVVENIPIFEEEQGPSGGGIVAPISLKPNYNLLHNDGKTILNEIGIKLVVTPQVFAETNVFLDLRPEVSVQGPDELKTIRGLTSSAPTFQRRTITTQAIVPSGHTLVLGGLESWDSSKSYRKVPILGDVPLIGLAFRHERKNRDKRNLLIFVTPTIVGHYDFQPTVSTFMQTRVPEHPDLSEDPMDRGKPANTDWTRP